jgi:hypothetical protein
MVLVIGEGESGSPIDLAAQEGFALRRKIARPQHNTVKTLGV